jgi:teichuronic acid biosynthesis glycosyltransferase TuaC
MRVLWTHNFDPDKSKQVYLQTTAEGVRKRGVDPYLEYLGNLRSVRNLWRARRRVRELSKKFDIVHAQYGSACALATAGADGIPKVVSIRGNDWNIHQDSFEFHYFHTRLASAMTRLSLGRYDCVLAVSQRLATALKNVFPRSNVATLPSPIDLGRFIPRDKQEARAILGFPNNTEKWVLFNSLILDNPVKRFTLAKQAFELANRRWGNLRFRVANDLPHELVPLFTAACDLILCTSETEGWPNSVKEALACNVPFVSTDVSDLAEIARKDGSCRICSPVANALADGICEALAWPEPRNVRRHVARMSLDATSDRLIGIYDSLISRHLRVA